MRSPILPPVLTRRSWARPPSATNTCSIWPKWVRALAAGKLTAPGTKPVTPEQMELSRLRAENARLKMHVDILKKATAYFAKDAL